MASRLARLHGIDHSRVCGRDVTTKREGAPSALVPRGAEVWRAEWPVRLGVSGDGRGWWAAPCIRPRQLVVEGPGKRLGRDGGLCSPPAWTKYAPSVLTFLVPELAGSLGTVPNFILLSQLPPATRATADTLSHSCCVARTPLRQRQSTRRPPAAGNQQPSVMSSRV